MTARAGIPCDYSHSVPGESVPGCSLEATDFVLYGPPVFDPPVLLCRCAAHPFTFGELGRRVPAEEALVHLVMTS